MKEKKKLKKRDLDKYPALNPKLNARTRFELLDMDYLRDLDDAELKYLNQFMAEWVSGAFKKDGDDYSDQNFYKTKEERQERWRNNNGRNRCQLTIANATGMSLRSDDISAIVDDALFKASIEDNKVEKFVIRIEDAGGYETILDKEDDERYVDYLALKAGKTTLGKGYEDLLLKLYDPEFKKKP